MTRKKTLGEIWDETPRKFGVWVNIKTRKIAVAKDLDGNKWTIDKGKMKQHPIFRAKYGIHAEGNGDYFFNRELKGHEFLQTDTEGFTPGATHD